jgi:L,D-peptidoglycan transpeptidase YkuD (ErfK/YbiS/YcfS/YnhG family)
VHHNVHVRRSIIPVLVALVTSCGATSSGATDPTSSSAGVPASSPTIPVVAPSTPLAPSVDASTGTAALAPPPTSSLVVATSAVATTPATRVVPVPDSTCEQIATRLATDHAVASQFVIVRTGVATDTTAILQVADRSGLGWTCGPEMIARVGRAGVRPLLDRRSGDGTTPAGVFPLATMTAWDGQAFSFFGSSADPGVVAGTYRRTKVGDCFGATPNTPTYGHLRYDTRCPGPDDEYLPSIGAYTNAALIGANMEPDVSGDAPGEPPYASAIFLHRFTYATTGATSGATKSTSGCVSLAQVDLSSVLVQMRADVRFAIGTTDWLLAGASG